MKRYRMTFKFRIPAEKLEYYFLIRDEESAKKHFTMKMCKFVKQESLKFDQLYISVDGCCISVIYEEKEYLVGKLSCVPTRFQLVNDSKLVNIKMESITKALGKYCKTVRTGYYKRRRRP